MFMGNFFTFVDFSVVGEVMISRSIVLKKPCNSVNMDLRLALT